MSKIIKFVDGVPIYDDDYVYLEDWCAEHHIDFDDATEKDRENFTEWAEENELYPQEV